MHTAHCLECNAEFKIEELRKDIFAKSVPSCPKERQVDMCRDGIDLSAPPDSKVECMGIIKPDIVFFGESLPKVSYKKSLIIVVGETRNFAHITSAWNYWLKRVCHRFFLENSKNGCFGR